MSFGTHSKKTIHYGTLADEPRLELTLILITFGSAKVTLTRSSIICTGANPHTYRIAATGDASQGGEGDWMPRIHIGSIPTYIQR